VTGPNSFEADQIKPVADALRARDAKRAAALAEVVLASGIRHPILFNARAIWRAENGQHLDALVDFQRAAALSPTNPNILSALGICLTQLGRFDEAADAFASALKSQPNSELLHRQRASALEHARDLAGAKAAYHQALRIGPENPDILGPLAFISARQGLWQDARDYAERARRVKPSHQTARLVEAMCDLQSRALDRAETSLLELLADKATAGNNRALALNLLGDLRDRQSRFTEAFDAYSNSNRERQSQQFAPTSPGGIAMSEIVGILTGHFKDRAPAARRPSSQSRFAKERGHAFLLGFLRSGTTLLEQILASHGDVVTLEEKGATFKAVGDFMPWPEKLNALANAPESVLDEYREDYWNRVRGHGVNPVIAHLFPDAKILFALRDPRDVVWSCFHTYFNINSTTFEFLSLDGAAKFYAAVMQLAAIYRRVLPIEVHELRHEVFVSDLETEARKLCAILNVDWDESMMNFAERAKLGTIATASAPQIGRGLNREGFGRWRTYAQELAPILPILQPWVEEFHYSP
jgi:Flp pilus assembly protein TadD